MLSKKEFIEAASKNFVLVELDFPKKTPLPKEQAEKNEEHSETYKIRFFPTIVLTDADGKEFARGGSRDMPDIEKSLTWLNTQLEKKDMQ